MSEAARAYRRSRQRKATKAQVAEIRELQKTVQPEFRVGDLVRTPTGDDGHSQVAVVEKVLKADEGQLRLFIASYLVSEKPGWPSGEDADNSNERRAGLPVGTAATKAKRAACYKYKLVGIRKFINGTAIWRSQ
jgi:hypothetical protein